MVKKLPAMLVCLALLFALTAPCYAESGCSCCAECSCDSCCSEEPQDPDAVSEVAGLTGTIMDIINGLKGSEGLSVDAIRGLVEEFRSIGG